MSSVSLIVSGAPSNRMSRFALLVLFLFPQAQAWPASYPGIGAPVSWDRLAGWATDHHAAAWPALLHSCTKIGGRPDWRAVCRAAAAIDKPTNAKAKAFFETHFRPHLVYGKDGYRDGLITGYYVPLLHGSLKPTERYRYPLYAPPPDLLTVDLDEVYPALADRQLRGRLVDGKIVPYPTRAELEASREALSGSELLWVDNAVDAFFLQIQGSGRVRLPDGRLVAVGFADHNGRPYRSIGRRLIDLGELDRQEVNLFSIRRWLREHPDRVRTLLNYDPRYIFFRVRGDASGAPLGALGVPLSPGRSVAVDDDKIPLGVPIWLETTMPGVDGQPLNRLMMAQDTGGAIQGYTRADVFWGLGVDAESKAGLMKERGRMFLLLPR